MISVEEVINMAINLSMRASQAEAKAKEWEAKNSQLEKEVKELKDKAKLWPPAT